MSFTFVVLIIAFVSLALNVLIIHFYGVLKDKKNKAENEAVQARSDLNYYMEVNKIKKEVSKDYAEKEKKLNTGDVHSRNSYAADILRNNQKN